MSKPLIWFFKMGSFSHINAEVAHQLGLRFPEAEVRTMDVLSDIVELYPLRRILAFGTAGLTYAPQIFKTHQHPRDFYTRLTWVWRFLNQRIERLLEDKRTWFSFQTQSLFNAGVSQIPHFVYTDHTLLANKRYQPPKRGRHVSKSWKRLESQLYTESICTFTTSRFCTRSLMEDYGLSEDQAPCVYSGSNIQPLPGQQHDPRTPRAILFVGVEWKRKGGPELVAAFRDVRKQFPQATLWIVGCRPGIKEEGIKEFGRIPLEEVRRLYASASIFCLPSLREPSATVLMEAAAFALPVVATNVGGTPDRVINGETGWLIPSGNQEALAGALCEAISQPEEAMRRGLTGFQRYKEHFTWDAVGRKIEVIIRNRMRS